MMKYIKFVMKNKSSDNICTIIKDKALSKGSLDNISCIVYELNSFSSF